MDHPQVLLLIVLIVLVERVTAPEFLSYPEIRAWVCCGLVGLFLITGGRQ